jgi:hypothetical protein
VFLGLDQQKSNALRSSNIMFQSFVLSVGYAAFFTFSTPKGTQVAEDTFYVAVVSVNAGLLVAAYAILDLLDATKIVHASMFFCGPLCLLHLIRSSRRYISMHSDAQIEEHLTKSAVIITGMLGPLFFLFAESFSCISSEVDFELQCMRLVNSNYGVAFHLVAAATFYLATAIADRHLSRDDTISFRNADAGFWIRGVLQLVAWMLALCLFGTRPRDVGGLTEGAESELLFGVQLYQVTIEVSWILLWVWECIRIKRKIKTDLILSGELEQYEEEQSWLGAMWEGWWDMMDRFVAKYLIVDSQTAKVSSFYLWVAFFLSWICIIVPNLALAVLFLVQEQDSNVAVLIYQYSRALQIPGANAMAAYSYLNMESREASKCWRYNDFHPFLLFAGSVMRVIWEYFALEEFPVGRWRIAWFAFLSARPLDACAMRQTPIPSRSGELMFTAWFFQCWRSWQRPSCL